MRLSISATLLLASFALSSPSFAETVKQCDKGYWQVNALLNDFPPRMTGAKTFEVFVIELKRSQLCERLQSLAFVGTAACDFSIPELAERNERLLVKVEPKLLEMQLALAVCRGTKLLPLEP